MEYAQILISTIFLLPIFICLLVYYFLTKQESSVIPVNWPFIGMIPTLLSQMHQAGVERVAQVLQQTRGTFVLKGPWLSKMEILLTADPANVLYIMCKRHDAFHKDANFNDIFSELGDGIFNSDDVKWRYQRKIALSTLSSTRFRHFMDKVVKDKVEKGLIPILGHFHKRELVVDLQDVLERLTCDVSIMLLSDIDPNFLSLDLPNHPLCKGGHHAEEAIYLRYILPKSIWKLQRKLGLGSEKKARIFVDAVDTFFYDFIEKKRENVRNKNDDGESGADLLSIYLEENYGTTLFKSPNAFLRDTFLNFLLAGQDTLSASLSWFFWLLIKHPHVESKIKEHIGDDVENMVYLHAALLEALRLYPPVPFNHKVSKKTETLPSGHQVKPCMTIIVSSHAMGRMKWVWGQDCDEFKPDRWITRQGTIRHEPSHKFLAFNTGPRACVGKEMALAQMKVVVCHVLRHNYRFELMEDHRVKPSSSMVFRMKNGLKVKVMKIA